MCMYFHLSLSFKFLWQPVTKALKFSRVNKRNFCSLLIKLRHWLVTKSLFVALRFRVVPISQTNLLDGGNHFIISIIRFLEPSQKGVSFITNFCTKYKGRVPLRGLCHQSFRWLALKEWNGTLHWAQQGWQYCSWSQVKLTVPFTNPIWAIKEVI